MKINQDQIRNNKGQIEYLGRWVDRKSFRAFVYSFDGKEQKLANSYEEFKDLISSGIWFIDQDENRKAAKPLKSKNKLKSDDFRDEYSVLEDINLGQEINLFEEVK